MPIFFNPIACIDSDVTGLKNLSAGRSIENAIVCSCCGATYHIIVPTTSSDKDVDGFKAKLRQMVSASCGEHPPLVQLQ
jgi:hypothetical protein